MALPNWTFAGNAEAVSDPANADVLRDPTSLQHAAVVDVAEQASSEFLASTPGIEATAASAVAARIAAADLVQNKPVGKTTYGSPFTSRNKKQLGGINPDGQTDGTIVFETLRLTGPQMARVASAADAMTKSSLSRWYCGVDSLTRGFNGSGDWPLADAWPAKLAGLLNLSNPNPAVTVSNNGTSGQPIDEFNIRIGALSLSFAVAGNAIPAAGTAVVVTTTQVIGWVPGRNSTFLGSLVTSTGAQIAGTLTRAGGGSSTDLTFTPSAGAGTAVTGNVTFKSADDSHSWDSLLIWAGRNDVSYEVKGAEGTVADHVVAGVVRAVNYMKAQRKRFLILSGTNSTTETTGTAGYATLSTIWTRLVKLFPFNTEDLRYYIVHQAIYDLAIPPTATDLAKMAADAPPPSLVFTGDTIHFIKALHPLIAAFVFAAMQRRDWVLAA